MTDKSDELRDAIRAAQRDERAVKERRRDAIDRAKAVVEAEYEDEYNKAATAVAAAEAALSDYENEQALAKAAAFTPTRYIEWKHQYGAGYKKTGRVGVTEILTKDSLKAANMPAWRDVNLGETIFRILKKDGTPMARYERASEYILRGWYREDVDPNNKGKKP